MKSTLVLVTHLMFVALFGLGTSTVSAAELTIETKSPTKWVPKSSSALVGDVVVWKMGAGTQNKHGVRITNWAAVKDHVEVETVTDQQPFNATKGENDNSTNTGGKVLLRLNIKSFSQATPKITFECIEHGIAMTGEITLGQ